MQLPLPGCSSISKLHVNKIRNRMSLVKLLFLAPTLIERCLPVRFVPVPKLPVSGTYQTCPFFASKCH
jgi:hypothetical protein